MADYDSFAAFVAAGHASFSRDSIKWAPDAQGVYEEVAADTLARNSLGVLLEPAETYYPVNAELTGAVVGTDGVDGDLPDGWAVTSGAFPRPIIEAVTTVDGLPAIVVTFRGTNEGGGTTYPGIRFPIAAAALGEIWTTAVWHGATFGQDDVGIDTRLQVQQVDSGGGYLSTTLTALVADGSRQSASNTFDEADVAGAMLVIDHMVEPGMTLDRTLTLVCPTMTRGGGGLSSPLITDGTNTATRAVDVLTLALPDAAQALTVRFDDNSTQTLSSVSGAYQIEPAGFDRPRVRSLVARPA